MSGIKISQLTSSGKKSTQQKERQRRAQVNLSELSEVYRFKREALDNSNSKEKLATNRQQTSNKPPQNRGQSENKPLTNWQQTDNKRRSKGTTKTETGNKVVAKPTTKVETKWQQTENKPTTKVAFSSLVGLQRRVTLFLYKACKSARSKSTEALSLQHIAQSLETTTGSVKTTLQRLEKKGCITRVSFKNGRGGWSKYELSEELYRDLLQQETDNKLATNWQQTENKVGAKVATELATTLPSSNSSNITNTITTKKPDNSWLQEIQIPENLKSLGFGVSHLKQLKSKFALSPNEIQHGLEAFSFDLENGEGERLKARGIQNLIGFFFGAMKNGGYNPVNQGFETAEDAAEKEMLERLKKRSEEKEKRKKELEDLLFQEWIEAKGEEELTQLSPPPVRFMDTFHKADLKNYFRENVMDDFKRDFQ